ncbi:uncharacterized protein LOC143824717 isoform X2 [Paroedura picta]|uniref:uncharacterized protein LOC143824717 isoform X2 n=1 Tax=Paroedura picta TaxID=143630 RepID=UPI004057B2C7
MKRTFHGKMEAQLNGLQTISPIEANAQDQDPDSDSGASTQIDGLCSWDSSHTSTCTQETQMEREREKGKDQQSHTLMRTQKRGMASPETWCQTQGTKGGLFQQKRDCKENAGGSDASPC